MLKPLTLEISHLTQTEIVKAMAMEQENTMVPGIIKHYWRHENKANNNEGLLYSKIVRIM